jgi:hypothetical protein
VASSIPLDKGQVLFRGRPLQFTSVLRTAFILAEESIAFAINISQSGIRGLRVHSEVVAIGSFDERVAVHRECIIQARTSAIDASLHVFHVFSTGFALHPADFHIDKLKSGPQ